MLCVPLDWKYAELPSLASDAVKSVVYLALHRCIHSKLLIYLEG